MPASPGVARKIRVCSSLPLTSWKCSFTQPLRDATLADNVAGVKCEAQDDFSKLSFPLIHIGVTFPLLRCPQPVLFTPSRAGSVV